MPHVDYTLTARINTRLAARIKMHQYIIWTLALKVAGRRNPLRLVIAVGIGKVAIVAADLDLSHG